MLERIHDAMWSGDPQAIGVMNPELGKVLRELYTKGKATYTFKVEEEDV